MMRRLLRASVFPVLIILLWEITSRTGLLQFEYLSRPSDILLAGHSVLLDGSILLATWQTFEAALFGLMLAVLVGILAGTILGLSSTTERIVGPTIEALRPIPAVAFIPLSLLLFGFGLPMEGMVVAYACVWPILIATIGAVRGIEPRLLEVARALELSFSARLWKIVLPAALSRINVGIRVAVGFALVVAVTVEIIVNPRGLGYSLILAQQSLRVDLMYAQLLWLCIVGYAINAALRTVKIAQPSIHVGGRP
jgi:ABC-type nitrate/sulfonate/bicarbonate transport system permease component